MKRIVADPRKCLACRTCEWAWRMAHAESEDLRQLLGGSGPRPAVYIQAAGQLAVPLQCRHCDDAPCVEVCPTAAPSRLDADGPVLADQGKCIGCEFCVQACPFGVIRLTSDRKMIIKCDLCAARLAAGRSRRVSRRAPSGLSPSRKSKKRPPGGDCKPPCDWQAGSWNESFQARQTTLRLSATRRPRGPSGQDHRSLPGCPEMLIPMLQDLQAAEGYLPREQLRILSHELAVPLSRHLQRGNLLRLFPPATQGRTHDYLVYGNGLLSQRRRRIAAAIQQEFEVGTRGTSPDGKFSFSPVNCLGTALAPVMVVDGEYFGGLTVTSTLGLLQKIAAGKRVPSSGVKAEQGNGSSTST